MHFSIIKAKWRLTREQIACGELYCVVSFALNSKAEKHNLYLQKPYDIVSKNLSATICCDLIVLSTVKTPICIMLLLWLPVVFWLRSPRRECRSRGPAPEPAATPRCGCSDRSCSPPGPWERSRCPSRG